MAIVVAIVVDVVAIVVTDKESLILLCSSLLTAKRALVLDEPAPGTQ